MAKPEDFLNIPRGFKANHEMIKQKVLEEADKRENAAAHNGEFGDGGARTLREQVKFYNYGQQGIIPPEWNKYEKELDPEYEDYLRLKKKFGNK